MTKEQYAAGTLEITTRIGCSINCRYCPQELLMKCYFSASERPAVMDFDLYCRCLDKVPAEVKIDFAGMCEPWLNDRCTDMVEYAVEKGHLVGIFTTLRGMTEKDVERLLRLEIEQMVLHVPDEDGHTMLSVTDEYLRMLGELLEHPRIQNRGISCHGRLPETIQKMLRDMPEWSIGTDLIDRAGNLTTEGVRHQSINGRGIFCDMSGLKLNHNILLPDGTVLLCCMDYGMQHTLGNLTDSSYDEITDGDVIQTIRRAMETEQADGNLLCRNCTNALRLSDAIDLYMDRKLEAYCIWTNQQRLMVENRQMLRWVGELMNGKDWLEEQLQNRDVEIENLRQVEKEHKKWIYEQEKARDWLEQQLRNKDKEIENLQLVEKENRKWIHELEEARDWLAGQRQQMEKYIRELEAEGTAGGSNNGEI